MNAYLFTRKSQNVKTGPIPVTSAPRQDCAPDCPLKANGCYADNYRMGALWDKLSDTKAGKAFKNGNGMVKTVSWDGLCDSVSSLPDKQLWRHDQMGDLPHNRGKISRAKLFRLVKSNTGKRGFTYSHHNVLQSAHNRRAIESANLNGFTINLSGNNAAHADQLAALDIAPVVTIMPAATLGQKTAETPEGRPITMCPGQYIEALTCEDCGLCEKQCRAIVGFAAHGAGKSKAENI